MVSSCRDFVARAGGPDLPWAARHAARGDVVPDGRLVDVDDLADLFEFFGLVALAFLKLFVRRLS